MLLVALRSEYQISVDVAKNRVFYQNFEPMQSAMFLTHYMDDWAAALAEVRPGFSILADLQVVNQANPDLLATFRAVERLLAQHGAGVIAEVHVPGLPTRRHSDEVSTGPVPVRQFLTLWEAAHFLDHP